MIHFFCCCRKHKIAISVILSIVLIALVTFLVWIQPKLKTETVSNGTAVQASLEAIPTSVSIISLIANPEKYDGKHVCVIGIGNIEFEGDAVYLSKADYKNCIYMNALSVVIDHDVLNYKKLRKLNGKYVLIEGIFKKHSDSLLNLFSGTLTQVKRYEAWK